VGVVVGGGGGGGWKTTGIVHNSCSHRFEKLMEEIQYDTLSLKFIYNLHPACAQSCYNRHIQC